jgi:large subunit ribosomal protein L21
MQAIVKTGGKQYTVKEGDLIKVEKIEGEIGSEVILDNVLMVKGDGEGAEVKIGTPKLPSVSVRGEIVDQGRRKKIVVYTFKRRKGFEKKKGHRQTYTAIRVKEILGASL